MRTMSVKKLTLVYSWEKYQWLIANDIANDIAVLQTVCIDKELGEVEEFWD